MTTNLREIGLLSSILNRNLKGGRKTREPSLASEDFMGTFDRNFLC